MNYLRPWQRRIGVIALVMARVFAGGWVRSFSASDWLHWRMDDRYICSASSNLGRLSWEGLQESVPFQVPQIDYYLTGNAIPQDFLGDAQQVRWHWTCCGFEFGATTMLITGWSKSFGAVGGRPTDVDIDVDVHD